MHTFTRRCFRLALALFVVYGLALVAAHAGPKTMSVEDLLADDLAVALQGAKEEALPWGVTGASADKIQRAYEANEVAADLAYSGKTVGIVGYVGSIDLTIGDTPVLRLKGGSNPYLTPGAFMRRSDVGWLAQLKKGDFVILVCQRPRMIMKSVALYDCQPRTDYIRDRVARYIAQAPAAAARGDVAAGQILALRDRCGGDWRKACIPLQ